MALLDSRLSMRPNQDVIDLGNDMIPNQGLIAEVQDSADGLKWHTCAILPIPGQLMRYMQVRIRQMPKIGAFRRANEPLVREHQSSWDEMQKYITGESIERNPYDRP